ncbi:MAG: 2-oxoglutarate dehydrogenase E1 component [Chloroflexota bacterium]
MDSWQDFPGPNAGYVAELYERYSQDPNSVDEATRAYFARVRPAVPPPAPSAGYDPRRAVAVANLAQSIRDLGHLGANLDPLGGPPHGDPALELATYGLTEADLRALPADVIVGPSVAEANNAAEAIDWLRRVYCGSSGYEFGHAHDATERAWLRQAIECEHCGLVLTPEESRDLLERLSEVETFERYLHRTFPGQTRFSIEGLDMMVPLLDEAVKAAVDMGTCEIVLAMAHRGRLNVLAHVLGKPYSLILAEFEGKVKDKGIGPAEGNQFGWTGDVKYHMGGRRAYREGGIVTIVATLAPNPSHLEYVNPVAEGMTRASDDGRDKPGAPIFYPNASLPIIIHGDAAFPGQGVVAETLNLSGVDGYRNSGTIHIIANNQLGFTTQPEAGRSTLYSSDLAKGFEIPVVHVNADDPEACLGAMRLAVAYRQRFRKDFVIDLIGYRRHGHNEGDDPTFTQPLMYARIAQQPTVREKLAQRLVQQGVVAEQDAESMVKLMYECLQRAREAKPESDEAPRRPSIRRGARADAAKPPSLSRLNEEICRLPHNFALNARLARVHQRRCAAFEGDGNIDWGHAEQLAFASILAGGTPIRLTGQDAERGTFSQRHAVLHDQNSGTPWIPLQQMSAARASFAVHNSPLSESAVLGFEYGYSVHAPDTLVVWEAQYGDFANSAQVIIDQFIVSGKAKWQSDSSLVLLLPHGFEGQGPEHSSARLERFLEQAAEENLRIANCSTAGQYFHLLRWQAALLRSDPRPLVVMTPKSLLRLPEAAAQPRALVEGQFQPVLDDPVAAQRAEQVTRLLLCSGKVYYDLVGSQARQVAETAAVARVELLYPLPEEELRRLLARYQQLRQVIWVQEEPQNMGAWHYMSEHLWRLLPQGVDLGYVGRPPRASPAEGTAAWHAQEQARIVSAAFGEVSRPREMLRGAGHAG